MRTEGASEMKGLEVCFFLFAGRDGGQDLQVS